MPVPLPAEPNGVRPRKRGGELTGPSPVDRGKPGSKTHVLPDANGLPLLIGLSAANTHDSLALKPMITGHPTRHDPTEVGTSSPSACMRTRRTASLTWGDGSGASTPECASPARESKGSPDDDYRDVTSDEWDEFERRSAHSKVMKSLGEVRGLRRVADGLTWEGSRRAERRGCLVNPAQPVVEGDEVRFDEAQAGVDAMEQSMSWMVRGYPGAIGVGDLVVDPCE